MFRRSKLHVMSICLATVSCVSEILSADLEKKKIILTTSSCFTLPFVLFLLQVSTLLAFQIGNLKKFYLNEKKSYYFARN